MAANLFGRYVWLIDSYTGMNQIQADQIEVIVPASVRKQMRNFAKSLMSYYREKGL